MPPIGDSKMGPVDGVFERAVRAASNMLRWFINAEIWGTDSRLKLSVSAA